MSVDKEKVVAVFVAAPFAIAIILFIASQFIWLPSPAQIYADLVSPPGIFVLLTVFHMFHKKLFASDIDAL